MIQCHHVRRLQYLLMKDIPVVLLIIRLFIQGTQSKDSVLDKVQISQINQVICLHIILININRHSISQRMLENQAERNRKVIEIDLQVHLKLIQNKNSQ